MFKEIGECLTIVILQPIRFHLVLKMAAVQEDENDSSATKQMENLISEFLACQSQQMLVIPIQSQEGQQLHIVHLEYKVYKKRNLGISQEIDIVLRTKDFRCLGI